MPITAKAAPVNALTLLLRDVHSIDWWKKRCLWKNLETEVTLEIYFTQK